MRSTLVAPVGHWREGAEYKQSTSRVRGELSVPVYDCVAWHIKLEGREGEIDLDPHRGRHLISQITEVIIPFQVGDCTVSLSHTLRGPAARSVGQTGPVFPCCWHTPHSSLLSELELDLAELLMNFMGKHIGEAEAVISLVYCIIEYVDTTRQNVTSLPTTTPAKGFRKSLKSDLAMDCSRTFCPP